MPFGHCSSAALGQELMPRRSNEFQRLVRAIYVVMATIEGGKVTESAILYEPNGTPREVDILLEASIYDSPLRIAVECRDRSRKSDIEWIDGLIGKYRDLPVHKVIAVSRRGFSATAAEKAVAARIAVCSVEQCDEADWSSEFAKLGVGQFTITLFVESVDAELSSTPDPSITMESIIKNQRGDTLGTVAWMLSDCYDKAVLPRIKEFIDKELLPGAKVLADLQRKWALTVPIAINDVFIDGHNGARYEVKKLTFVVKTQTDLTTSVVEHYKYGEKTRASVATLEYPGAKQRLRIVQVAGSNHLSITTEVLK